MTDSTFQQHADGALDPTVPTDIAVGFLTLASTGHAKEAFDQYAAPDFAHHNPFLAGDAETLISAMDENAKANPHRVFEILRTIAEGSFVAVHSRVRQDSANRGAAVIHIFRIEGGRIRELWDVDQPVPADSPNEHGMF